MPEPGVAVAVIFAVCCSVLALIVSVVNYVAVVRTQRLFIAHLRAWHRGPKP